MSNTFNLIATPFRGNLTMEDNMKRLEDCIEKLIARNVCDFKTVLGVYHEEGMPEATREVSLMITQLSWSEVKSLKELFVNDYEQDCVLVINDVNKHCTLMGNDWCNELGAWSQVSREVAHEAGIYTFDNKGRYWLAK